MSEYEELMGRYEDLYRQLTTLEDLVKRLTSPHFCRFTVVMGIEVGGGTIDVLCCEVCNKVK